MIINFLIIIQVGNMLSVIVAIYNVENYLRRCLDSIVKQSLFDLEIILVDDGSDDTSGEISDEYAILDSRIKVIHQVNKGPYEARKTGLKYANGEYVIFVDGDDEIDGQLCERMLSLIVENKTDFVHCNFLTNGKLITRGIKQTKKLDFDRMSVEDRKKIIAENVLSRKAENDFICPSTCSKIFEKKFIGTCFEKMDTNSRYGEDLILLCHIIMNAKKGMVCTDAFYNYIQRAGSLSQKFDLYNLARISKMFYELKDTLNTYGMNRELNIALNNYYSDCIMNSLSRLESARFHFNQYMFPQIDMLREKSVIIYGAGKVGRDYYDQLSRYKDIEIVAWVDKAASDICLDYFPVNMSYKMQEFEADIVLIAVKEFELSVNIKKELEKYGIDMRKVIWCKPDKTIEDEYACS